MSWAEERRADREATRAADRADRATEREQDRADRIAAAEARRADAAAAEEIRAGREETRKADEEKARARRKEWRSKHAVELLIYPLALVSAVMAIPAMAIYGWDVYGNPTGLALPLISELAVWAFSIAILVSRRRHPQRPTVMLTAGMVLFGGVAFGLNFAHGLGDGVLTGLVMGVVSVAGVVAHQLAVAAPPRSRAQRAQARIDRIEARRVARARRIAARTAVVELAADGSARLVHRPGLYTPTRRRLDPTTVPGLPTGTAGEADPADDWDAAMAVLDVDGGPVERAARPGPAEDPTGGPTEPTGQVSEDVPAGGPGPVGLLERPESDSESGHGASESAELTSDAQALEEARWLARRTQRPLTERTVRVWVGVGAARARAIRDQVNTELFGDRS